MFFMKKTLLLCFILSIPFSIFAQDYSQCGPKPGVLERLFTDVEKVRAKCIDDIYNKHRDQVLREANTVSDLIKQVQTELGKVANNYDPYMGVVNCKAEQRPRCEELVTTLRALVDRLNKLMGWDKVMSAPKTNAVKTVDMKAPCPSKEELDKMKGVRYFHKKLYQTWERCVQLNPESYFEQ